MGVLRPALLLLLALAGCEVEPPAGRFPDRDAAPVGGDATAARTGELAARTLDEPAGTWVLFVEDRKCIEVTQLVSEHLIWSIYRVLIEDDGAGAKPGERHLRLDLKLCGQETSPVVGLTTQVPPSVAENIPPDTTRAIQLGPISGDAVVTGETVELWGMRGVDATEPLPETADDPRVYDQDGDGAPGITLVVGDDFCRVDVVERHRMRLSGKVVDSAHVAGAVWSQVDKKVMEATSPLCAAENPLSENPEPSSFELVRADGRYGGFLLDYDEDGEVTCAEILQAESDLRAQGVGPRSGLDSEHCK